MIGIFLTILKFILAFTFFYFAGYVLVKTSKLKFEDIIERIVISIALGVGIEIIIGFILAWFVMFNVMNFIIVNMFYFGFMLIYLRFGKSYVDGLVR